MSNVIDFAKYKERKEQDSVDYTYTLDFADIMTYTITLNDLDYEVEIGEDTVIIKPGED